jgi:hypothetical protein
MKSARSPNKKKEKPLGEIIIEIETLKTVVYKVVIPLLVVIITLFLRLASK